MRILYDIETNGLLPECDTVWCLVAKNLDTGAVYRYSDHDPKLPSMADACRVLESAGLLVGHNIIGFDNAVMHKIYGIDLNQKRCHDTLIMSQVLRYKRRHTHGLKAWGEHLGNSKIDYDDWTRYSTEMLRYCVQDVNLNHDIYNKLLEEYNAIYKKNPLIREGLKIEHDTAVFNTTVRERGWKFDMERADLNLHDMQNAMARIEREIEPRLGTRRIYKDKEPKYPKYTKAGAYTATTARMLSEYYGWTIFPDNTHLHPAGKPFQRYSVEKVTLGSMALVKDWLLDNGWEPDEYQKKRVGFEWVTMGPKLTSSSLRKMGKIGEMIDDYYTIRNRASVIAGWIANQRDGRIHGNMWTIGTPTFRARHEVIVNLPAVSATYGKQLRELFIADDGMVVVGADSSGNQLRGLCHYVGNDSFTNEVIYGDQHQRNAVILGTSRVNAKSYLYAYLFGAGDAKLGYVLSGKHNPTIGRKSRSDFAKGIKGLQELKDRLSNVWRSTHYSQNGDGWFPALDGRPVFCPSEHQTLNYLLQSAEGITCKAAISWAMSKIKEEKLRAEPRLFYHDEQAWVSHPDDADRVGQILKESFKEGPKIFKVECMDGGDPVVGRSYADVH